MTTFPSKSTNSTPTYGVQSANSSPAFPSKSNEGLLWSQMTDTWAAETRTWQTTVNSTTYPTDS